VLFGAGASPILRRERRDDGRNADPDATGARLLDPDVHARHAFAIERPAVEHVPRRETAASRA
jgi:hypothetical protein